MPKLAVLGRRFFGRSVHDVAPELIGATLVYRGNRDKREFIAFWMLGGRVVAGMNVNVWDVNEDVQGLIRRGNIVDVAALSDPDVPLKSL